MSTDHKERRTRKTFLFILFIFSILFQSVIIFEVLPPNAFFKYQVAAQHYLTHELEQERLLDFSPLYFYVHVIVKTCFPNPNPVILGIHILLAALSALLLFHLLHEFFPLSISLIGTLVFMTHRSVIVYTSTFEPEPFIIFFLLGFLVFTLKPHILSKCVAGIFLSLSLLTRSNFFPLIIVTPLFFRFAQKDRKKWLRAVLVFEIPIFLALSFLTLRNSTITGSFTPFSMNPGYVFFEGNNPNSTGESAIYPPLIYDSRKEFPLYADFRHELYRLFARRITKQPLSIAEVNAFWTQNCTSNFPTHLEHCLFGFLISVADHLH